MTPHATQNSGGSLLSLSRAACERRLCSSSERRPRRAGTARPHRGLRSSVRASLSGSKPSAFREEAASLVSAYQDQGWVHVPQFLDASETAALVEEATRLLAQPGVFRSSESHNVYQDDPDANFPNEHPRNQLQESSKRIVHFGLLPLDSPLRALYAREDLRELVRRCAGLDTVYASACEYNAAYYNAYDAGDGLGWHFDRSRFGVNLILQAPEAGGAFEFHHRTRSDAEPYAFERVRRLLSDGGDLASEGVVRVEDEVEAGSLILFAGRHSLHRVTPVEGPTPRINAILTYESAPNQRLNAYSLKRFFGVDANADLS